MTTANDTDDLGVEGDLEVDGTLDFDGATADFDPTSEFQIDGALTDIGTGTYTLANGDNDLGIEGDLEVNTNAQIDGALTTNGNVDLGSDGSDTISILGDIDNDVNFDAGLSGGVDVTISTAAADTAGDSLDVSAGTGGVDGPDGGAIGANGGNLTLTGGAGDATTATTGGELRLIGGAGGTAGTNGAVRVGSVGGTFITANDTDDLGIEGDLEADGDVDFDATGGASGSADLNVAGYSQFAGTVEIDGASDLDSTLNVQDVATFQTTIQPDAASQDDIGTVSAEWDDIFVGDNNGLNLGLDQDAELAYDETTDDRVELAGTGASLWIEDRLSLGRQTFTFGTTGPATENLTPTASYVEVTNADDPLDAVAIQTGSAKEGDVLFITNVGTTACVIDSTGTVKIKTAVDVTISQYDVMILIFDGTNWLQAAEVTNNS